MFFEVLSLLSQRARSREAGSNAISARAEGRDEGFHEGVSPANEQRVELLDGK